MIQISESQEWADYQAALQAFDDAVEQTVDALIEADKVIIEALELQKEVLLNK